MVASTSSNFRALLEIIDLSIALGNGNLTGGNHVIFTSGDEMRGEDLLGPAGALFLRGGDSLGAGGDGGDISLWFGQPDSTGNVGTIYIGDTSLLPPALPVGEIPGSVFIGGDPQLTDPGGFIWVGHGNGNPRGLPIAGQAGSVGCLAGGSTVGVLPGGFFWAQGGETPVGAPVSGLGGIENAALLVGGTTNNADDAGQVFVRGGENKGTTGDGGRVNVDGGAIFAVTNLAGSGGPVYIQGGVNFSGNGFPGGLVWVSGGIPGGAVQIAGASQGGSAVIPGGPVMIQGGQTSGAAPSGSVFILGGAATAAGPVQAGDVRIAGGPGSGAGVAGGHVKIAGGLAAGGLPANGGNVEFAPGAPSGGGTIGVVKTLGATSGHQIEGYCTVGSLALPAGTEKLRVVGDARVEGKLTVTGLVDPTGLVLDEQAVRPFDPTGLNKGVFWVQTGTPCLPYFTDDAGTNHNLLAGGGGGVPTYDSYLDQGAGADADPIFTDMPAIAAKIAGLPTVSIVFPTTYPVTNTLHFIPNTNLSLVTPGLYAFPNTEIRGTAPIGPFGSVAYDAAKVIVSNAGGPIATFQDIRTFKDVCFQHLSSAVAPTFTFVNSPYCEFDNVSVSVPFNSSPTVGVWYQPGGSDFERLRINKTILNTTAFELDGGTLDVIVETDNVIAPGAFIGTLGSAVNLYLRGTGNYVSASQFGIALDIEIGDGSIGFPPMKTSGAETITFGAGDHSWNWSAGPVPPGTTGWQLRPGGGMTGDPAPPPDPGGGGAQLQAGRTVAGIVRGIHVQIGANVSNATFDVQIYEGGVLKYQEGPFSLLGCVGLGTYLSTTFAQLTGTFPLAVWIVPSALSQGDWDHINVSFFVR